MTIEGPAGKFHRGDARSPATAETIPTAASSGPFRCCTGKKRDLRRSAGFRPLKRAWKEGIGTAGHRAVQAHGKGGNEGKLVPAALHRRWFEVIAGGAYADLGLTIDFHAARRHLQSIADWLQCPARLRVEQARRGPGPSKVRYGNRKSRLRAAFSICTECRTVPQDVRHRFPSCRPSSGRRRPGRQAASAVKRQNPP